MFLIGEYTSSGYQLSILEWKQKGITSLCRKIDNTDCMQGKEENPKQLGKRITWSEGMKTPVDYKLNVKLIEKLSKLRSRHLPGYKERRAVAISKPEISHESIKGDREKTWISIFYRTDVVYYEHAWQTVIMDVIQRYLYKHENYAVFTYYDREELKEQDHDDVWVQLGVLNVPVSSKSVVESSTSALFFGKSNSNSFVIEEALVYLKVVPFDVHEELLVKIPFRNFVNGAKGEDFLLKRSCEQSFSKGIPECGADSIRLSCLETCNGGKFDDSLVFNNAIFIQDTFDFYEMLRERNVFCEESTSKPGLAFVEKFILLKFKRTVRKCFEEIKNYRFESLVKEIKSFYTQTLCSFVQDKKLSRKLSNSFLANLFSDFLQLLYPLCPFLTSFLFAKLHPGDSLLELNQFYSFKTLEFDGKVENVDLLSQELSNFIRKIKGCYRINQRNDVSVVVEDPNFETFSNISTLFPLLFRQTVTIKRKQPNFRPSEYICGQIGKSAVFLDIKKLINLKGYTKNISRTIKKTKQLPKRNKIKDNEKYEWYLSMLHESLKRLEGNVLDLVKEEEIRKFPIKDIIEKRSSGSDSSTKKKSSLRNMSMLEWKGKEWSPIETGGFCIENSEKFTELSISCYNVLHDLDRSKERILKSTAIRYPLIMKILAKQNSDVFVLNEVTSSFLQVLANTEYFRERYYVDRLTTSQPMQNTLLVAKNRFKKVKYYLVKVKEISNTVAVEVELFGCKKRVMITNSHFKAARRQSRFRVQQYTSLINELDTICADLKVDTLIMCGDFNTNSDQETEALNQLGMIDSWILLKGKGDKGYTIDQDENALLKLLKRVSWRKMRYDRVLVKNYTENALKAGRIEIFAKDKVFEDKYACSDHLGIHCVLKE